MTDKQRLELRLSEIRGRLNELGAVESLSDEQRAEMDKLSSEYRDVESRWRAAAVVEADDEARNAGLFAADAESAELRQLIDGASLGAIFAAAVESRATDGRERELQDHFKLSGNQVPLALLEERAITPAPSPSEERAITPAPSNVGAQQAPIIPAVFPGSVAAFLGVDMPSVAAGEAIYPVLTTRANVGGPHTDSSVVGETTGAFSAEVLSPARLQASFFYRRVDRAKFAGMDEALRMNLSDALSDALDKEVIAGANGLLGASVLSDNAASALATFADYRGLIYDRIDGRFASVAGDIRAVVGSAVYSHAAAQYRGNSADDSALDSLMRVSGGVRVSAHVPAVDNKKQNTIIRRGMRRDMVAPIWEGVTLIPDEITGAKKGEITITAVMLHAVKLLRADGFHKQELQVVA